jgi:hypothetical protein
MNSVPPSSVSLESASWFRFQRLSWLPVVIAAGSTVPPPGAFLHT